MGVLAERMSFGAEESPPGKRSPNGRSTAEQAGPGWTTSTTCVPRRRSNLVTFHGIPSAKAAITRSMLERRT